MEISKSKQDLLNALNGNYPLIYVVSEDERPVIDTINNFINESGEEFKFLSWDFNRNMKNLVSGSGWVANKLVDGKTVGEQFTFQKSLDYLIESKKNRIQVFFDIHKRLDSGDLKILTKFIRSVKDFTYESIFPFTEEYHMPVYTKSDSSVRKFLIFISPVLTIPKELESLMHIIHFENPDRNEMENLLDSFVSQEGITLENTNREKITESSLGLTETEAILALRKSYYLNNKKTIKYEDIQKEKIQIIRKKGTLDFVDVRVDKDSIGGFEELFSWLDKRRLLFDENTREKYNLSYPKGVMLTGVQGCGKSLAAKVIANEFDIPLLRLDMGSLFSKWVGESDQNLRKALKIAEKMSPCVLWIDEIEKSFSNSGNTHETTKRILGYFLTWLQENELPVFIVATANNIDGLPPEFLRKGRFDEIWFVDLPNFDERKAIFEVHWNNRNLSFSNRDLNQMSEQTEGYSGAEIEAIVKESVLSSLFNSENEISINSIINEIKKITPLSVTNKLKIDAIRNWAFENQVRTVSGNPKKPTGNIGF